MNRELLKAIEVRLESRTNVNFDNENSYKTMMN